jgi:hypothetical protein
MGSPQQMMGTPEEWIIPTMLPQCLQRKNLVSHMTMYLPISLF